jgi:hypothetical protein
MNEGIIIYLEKEKCDEIQQTHHILMDTYTQLPPSSMRYDRPRSIPRGWALTRRPLSEPLVWHSNVPTSASASYMGKFELKNIRKWPSRHEGLTR